MGRSVLWIFAAWIAGCSPQAALLASAVPDGTMSVLLSQTQRVADSNRRRIVELEQARDWQGLVRFAEDNIKRDPNTPDWWLVAGYAHTQQSQHMRAAECYMEAVRMEPDARLAWSLLAESYRAAGQPQRAANALSNALLARRDDVQLHWLMGETQSDMRRWQPAVSAYKDALRADPEYLPAWRGLKRAYGELGRAQEAREADGMVSRLSAEQAAKTKAATQQKQ
ncbi:MAG: tetratricopeptide repeat protein [Rhodospirillaceae bacterium]